jgi:hypothetical protein
MNDTSITTDSLDQIDEDILTHTVSDETLEAAAGTVRGDRDLHTHFRSWLTGGRCCSG